MRYLLDTNIVVWLANDYDSLSKDVQAIIDDYCNTLYISAETVRELIVAYRTKKLGTRWWKSEADVLKMIEDLNLEIIPITQQTLKSFANLSPDYDHGHKDPSDHLIIAQALALGIPLISADTRFPFYTSQGLLLIQNH